MSDPGTQTDRLSTFPPDGVTIEDYANPDLLDMIIWRHVMQQKDELIIRALNKGINKTVIADTMGIGRTTVWRIVDRWYRNGGI